MEQSKHSISSKDEVSPTWSRKRFPLFLYFFFFENAALRVRQRDPDRLSPNKRFSVLHVVSRTQTTDSKAHTYPTRPCVQERIFFSPPILITRNNLSSPIANLQLDRQGGHLLGFLPVELNASNLALRLLAVNSRIEVVGPMYMVLDSRY